MLIALHEEGGREADETLFLELLKGQLNLALIPRKRGGFGKRRGTRDDQIPVLLVRVRHQSTATIILDRVDAVHIEAVLTPLIDKDAILCTECVAAYSAFCRKVGVEHEVIRSEGPRARGFSIFRMLTHLIAASKNG